MNYSDYRSIVTNQWLFLR